jgi:hypothetical protein
MPLPYSLGCHALWLVREKCPVVSPVYSQLCGKEKGVMCWHSAVYVSQCFYFFDFFLNYTVQLRYSQRMHTHLYKYTYANPTSMSIFED